MERYARKLAPLTTIVGTGMKMNVTGKTAVVMMSLVVLIGCHHATSHEKYVQAERLSTFKITHLHGVEYSRRYVPRLEQAIILLEEALELDPDSEEAKTLLARSRGELNKHQQRINEDDKRRNTVPNQQVQPIAGTPGSG